MASSGSPWNSSQQRWLQAMGYTVLRHGVDDELEQEALAPAVAPEGPAEILAERSASYSDAPRPSGPRRAPTMDDAPRTTERTRVPPTATSAPAPAGRGGMRLPDRLQLAMLRASGLDPSEPAAQAEMDQWPVDALRGNGPAKRAFWPRLRALRRAQ